METNEYMNSTVVRHTNVKLKCSYKPNDKQKANVNKE